MESKLHEHAGRCPSLGPESSVFAPATSPVFSPPNPFFDRSSLTVHGRHVHVGEEDLDLVAELGDIVECFGTAYAKSICLSPTRSIREWASSVDTISMGRFICRPRYFKKDLVTLNGRIWFAVRQDRDT